MQTQADPLTTLSAMVGVLTQRLADRDKQLTDLEETIERMREWAVHVNARLPKPKKKRTAPTNTVHASDVERAYKIINKNSGRNYQPDSSYGKECRSLMSKHGPDVVCQVLAYACGKNSETGDNKWSRPSTLFRASNFRRNHDDMVSQS